MARMNQISILLGAGFSAPMGYPIGGTLNKHILNLDKTKFDISPDGKLFATENSRLTFGNPYYVYLDCCIDLIKAYGTKNKFDYEEFFEFLTNKDLVKEFSDIINSYENDNVQYDNITSNLEDIYNQLVSYFLKDKNGEWWYDTDIIHIGRHEIYNGFLQILNKWKRTNIIHVHTLNHDLLFESFNKTDYISGEISDGFEEIGSNFYGILKTCNNRSYTVRLERFVGNYNSTIRLYKLHGSLNYVLYYKTSDDGITLIPVQYIKTKYGIGFDGLLREVIDKNQYERYPFAYHANFLTGTTSKIKKYEDPFLYKPLFNLFKENLAQSKTLLVIGYGFKDNGINKILETEFRGDEVIIIDPFFNENSNAKSFVRKHKAKVILKGISELEEDEL